MNLEPIYPDPSGHFLVTGCGEPFFWLADTAWELFHRLNRAESEHYLETRRPRLGPAPGRPALIAFAPGLIKAQLVLAP